MPNSNAESTADPQAEHERRAIQPDLDFARQRVLRKQADERIETSVREQTAGRCASDASSRLSTSNCRRIRPRPAPSAARTVISRSRMVALASSMLATLQHAISRSSATAASEV